MPYRLSPLAERDLDEIWSYVAEDASPATADRLLDAIVGRFGLLAEQPRMGRLRPEFGAGVRSFTVENHVIYYGPDADILIARILHGRRDLANGAFSGRSVVPARSAWTTRPRSSCPCAASREADPRRRSSVKGGTVQVQYRDAQRYVASRRHRSAQTGSDPGSFERASSRIS
jgi:toxin ParE1/3/4